MNNKLLTYENEITILRNKIDELEEENDNLKNSKETVHTKSLIINSNININNSCEYNKSDVIYAETNNNLLSNNFMLSKKSINNEDSNNVKNSSYKDSFLINNKVPKPKFLDSCLNLSYRNAKSEMNIKSETHIDHNYLIESKLKNDYLLMEILNSYYAKHKKK